MLPQSSTSCGRLCSVRFTRENGLAEHRFSAHGWSATLRDSREGIVVEQDGRSYVMRRRRLSAELLRIVDLAFSYGSGCLIRLSPSMTPRHPSKAEADYVGFSKLPSHRWTFVIDQYSGGPEPSQITVHKHYAEAMRQAGIPIVWETAGGQNLFAPSSSAEDVLRAVTDDVIAAVDVGSRGGRPLSAMVGVISERALQTLFVDALRAGRLTSFGEVTKVYENPTFSVETPERATHTRDIPDVIAVTAKEMFVIELKLGMCGRASLHQLQRYMRNSEVLRLAGGRPVHGVLVGRGLSPDLAIPVPSAGDGRIRAILYQMQGGFSVEEVTTCR